MARKYRRELKKSDFWRFRGVEICEIHDFARNRQIRAKPRDWRAGPTQIDPRGSSGTKKFDILPYCDGYEGRNVQFRMIYKNSKNFTIFTSLQRCQNVTILPSPPTRRAACHQKSRHFGRFNSGRYHGETKVDFTTKWKNFLLSLE